MLLLTSKLSETLPMKTARPSVVQDGTVGRYDPAKAGRIGNRAWGTAEYNNVRRA
jgi:hypothetical protein